MNLNVNSKLSKLYRWFYDLKWFEMPTNGCRYFWSVLFMLIVFIPSTIISLPATIFSYFTEKKAIHHPGIGLIMWVMLFIGFSILTFIGASIINYDKESFIYQIAIFGGIFLTQSILAVIIYFIINYFQEKSNNIKTDNIVVEFVKEKINKYCPTINWIN